MARLAVPSATTEYAESIFSALETLLASQYHGAAKGSGLGGHCRLDASW